MFQLKARGRYWAALWNEKLGQPDYEVRESAIDVIPVQEVYRNGKRVATSGLAWYCGPPRFMEEQYCPSFTKGRCADLSDGDFKSVFADEDGQSGFVYKRYDRHIYHGDRYPDAQQRAQRAAETFRKIYAVLRKHCGSYILPTEIFVDRYSDAYPDDWCVYEKQQRALIGSPWLGMDLNQVWLALQKCELDARLMGAAVGRELLRDKIVPPSRTSPCGYKWAYCSFYPQHWDERTHSFVAIDVIDYVPEPEAFSNPLSFW